MSACVLDTDVVIAALDRQDAHYDAAAQLIRQLVASKEDLFLSAVNYAEVLVRPAEDETTLRAAVEAIVSLRIDIVSPDASLALQAARNRSLGVSLADGFALATASLYGASIASFDKRVRRALPELNLNLCSGLS